MIVPRSGLINRPCQSEKFMSPALFAGLTVDEMRSGALMRPLVVRVRRQASMTPVVFISAGEASGEHYGALLATALSQQNRSKR